MNIDTVGMMREMLASSGWVSRTRSFAATLRTAGHRPGGLLIVGTPTDEPWHLTAHLHDAARHAGLPQLEPTLVRHRIPVGAAPHLAVDLTRLTAATRGETVLVVTPDLAPTGLLSRIQDARHAGATILAIETGDLELQGLAHDTLTVAERLPLGENPTGPNLMPLDDMAGRMNPRAAFDIAQHLVSLAATERPAHTHSRPNLRERLTRSQT